jgi:hypothetical protein
MTANIAIGPFKPMKPNAVKWKRSLADYSDTATIKLPAIAMLRKDGEYKQVETGNQFAEGMPVTVQVGYDGKNETRFKGFVRRINYSIPLEVECEGYSYLLRKKLGFKNSYPSGIKMKTLLQDLVKDTDIKLSDKIPDITIQTPVTFPGSTGTQVLDWLKEKMLQTVYFNGDVLYVGLQQAEIKKTIKMRLGWNVIKDSELKFNDKKEFSEVKIEVRQRGKDGKIARASHDDKYTETKAVRLGVRLDKATMAAIAADQKARLVNRGYEGGLTTFLAPYVEPGMAVWIDDRRYPVRTGKYLVAGEEGDFSASGGRVKVKIGNSLGVGTK